MSKPVDTASPKKCAICGKPADPSLKLFCSRRCADVDLHRWLSGVYVVPTNETPDDEEEQPRQTDKDAD